MVLKLTPGQAVAVYGWIHAKQTLRWVDVAQHEFITYKSLRAARICPEALHDMQPDLDAWVRLRKATFLDCPDMCPWSPHPLKDFKADLADIIAVGWPPDVLASMGVTYDDLVDAGVAHANMGIFRFSLMGWKHLGFTAAHAASIPEGSIMRLFGVSKRDALEQLRRD